MRALTDKQRAFVLSLLAVGDDNFTRAARDAGFTDRGGNGVSIRVTAHRLAHHPKIQEAMQEEARRRLNSGLIMAVSTLATHVRSNDPKVSLKAIEMILNRGGIHAMSEHKVNVEHTMNEDEMVRSIAMMAKKMGVDPSSLLGDAGYKLPQLESPGQVPMEVIEGEYEDVTAGLDGLEDVL
jgi:phage terminase small subunit